MVLVVDEAQNLAREVLEQVRLLTNLETNTQKLLQIILIGQPELRELLGRNELRQLAQRITGRYHLNPCHARRPRPTCATGCASRARQPTFSVRCAARGVSPLARRAAADQRHL